MCKNKRNKNTKLLIVIFLIHVIKGLRMFNYAFFVIKVKSVMIVKCVFFFVFNPKEREQDIIKKAD